MATIHFNKEGFNKAITSGGITMVDFWASWCGPCRMLAPVIDDPGQQVRGQGCHRQG